MEQPPLEPDRLWQPPTKGGGYTPHDPLKISGNASPLAIFKVLAGSILAAAVIVGSLVHFYGQNQHMVTVEKVLVEPKILQQLVFSDLDATQKRVAYFNDKIALRPAGRDQTIQINHDEYFELYETIFRDEAIIVLTQALEARFDDPMHVAQLSIMVRSQERSGTTGPSVVFQQVEFLSDGSYYRVALRGQNGRSWKYFRAGNVKLGPLLNRLSSAAHEAT